MATAAAAEHGSDFHELTALRNLFECWLEASRNKGGRERIQRFASDPLTYLCTIQDRLRARRCTFGPYRTFTVREKKHRDVVDAPMKDRIVHWMLYRYLLPIWQPRFVADTFGNLPGRGTHAAIARLADFCRDAGELWALQLDISKYFYAVPHARLKERVLRHVGDHQVRALILDLIDSFRTDDRYDALFPDDSAYRSTAAKGMPIGNLSSQLFANIFLDPFDHWVKESLRIRRYLRYVDDLVMLHESPAQLNAWRAAIDAFLRDRLGIQLNPVKTVLQPLERGLDFAGQVIRPHHSTMRRRTLNSALDRLQRIPEEDIAAAANSYLGLARQASHGHRAQARICNVVRRRGFSVDHNLTKVYA